MTEAEFAVALRHIHTMIQLASYGPLEPPNIIPPEDASKVLQYDGGGS
jgi:hypothetical protein